MRAVVIFFPPKHTIPEEQQFCWCPAHFHPLKRVCLVFKCGFNALNTVEFVLFDRIGLRVNLFFSPQVSRGYAPFTNCDIDILLTFSGNTTRILETLVVSDWEKYKMLTSKMGVKSPVIIWFMFFLWSHKVRHIYVLLNLAILTILIS